jgi:hypothetical protein
MKERKRNGGGREGESLCGERKRKRVADGKIVQIEWEWLV